MLRALMPSNTRTLTIAHVVPLAMFMLLSECTKLVRVENPELPWFIRAPEHWVYPLQCLIIGALLIAWRRHYSLQPWAGGGIAVSFAFIGIGVWVWPSTLYVEGQPEWWEWLGITPRTEGFTPHVFAAHSSAWWLTVFARFVRMVLIVPLVEELLWRGFLMRYVQAGDKPWHTVPFGRHDWRAYAIVTVAVTLIHQPSDYLAAFVWGSLMYLLAVRTRSLGACILMHAVGNLLLGIYTLRTEQWGFW
jgi:uncharacterized protein